MGPTGSGKSSLVDLLSGRVTNAGATITGSIINNGKDLKNAGDFSQFGAYVQ